MGLVYWPDVIHWNSVQRFRTGQLSFIASLFPDTRVVSFLKMRQHSISTATGIAYVVFIVNQPPKSVGWLLQQACGQKNSLLLSVFPLTTGYLPLARICLAVCVRAQVQKVFLDDRWMFGFNLLSADISHCSCNRDVKVRLRRAKRRFSLVADWWTISSHLISSHLVYLFLRIRKYSNNKTKQKLIIIQCFMYL